MFSYLFRDFTRAQARKAIRLAVTSTVLIYLLLIIVAEPLRALGQVPADTVVQFTVTGALSMSCSTTSTLGSAVGTGTSGTGSMATATCTPSTNNSLGYTLSWMIRTGSGAPAVHAGCTNVNTCFGTGHLLSTNLTSGYPDVIRAFDRKGGFVNVPGRFDSTTIGSGSGARWAARLRANSTTTGGGSVTWGTDGATEGFLNVATGASVNIARRNNPTSGAGDTQNFLFKVVIPSGSFQPTGLYRATIRYTATDN